MNKFDQTNSGRLLICVEAASGAEFEELANTLLNMGYRLGATSVDVRLKRWAGMFELPTKTKAAERRIGELQVRIQQMLVTIKAYNNQDMFPEDALADLDSRLHAAFDNLCKIGAKE